MDTASGRATGQRGPRLPCDPDPCTEVSADLGTKDRPYIGVRIRPVPSPDVNPAEFVCADMRPLFGDRGCGGAGSDQRRIVDAALAFLQENLETP